MSNNAMSPLLSNAAEATRGRDVILVMHCSLFFEARHRSLACDEYARCNFAAGSIISWGQMTSNFLTFFIALMSCLLLTILRNEFSTDLIGIALAYSFLIRYFASGKY